MRPVLVDDVLAAVAVLMAQPGTRRGLVLARMIREADAADRHYRGTGRPHPLWGEGSLMTAARRRTAARVDLDRRETACIAAMVLLALAARRPEAGDGHGISAGSALRRLSASSPSSGKSRT